MQVTADTPLWLAARTLLGLRAAEFFRRWQQAVASFGLEEIHDLRVASRRFREGLDLFSPCYPAKSLARITRKVKQVTRCLGELRNTDEALLYLRRLGSDLGGDLQHRLTPTIDALQLLRKEEAVRVMATMQAYKPGKQHNSFKRTIASPRLFVEAGSEPDPFQPLPDFARQALAARFEPALALLPEAVAAAAVEAQHQLRIAVKHCRYRLEIFAPLVGSGYDHLHDGLKQYQELLGKMHDLDVFQVMVAERGGAGDPQARRLVKAIAGERQQYFEKFLAQTRGVPLARINAELRRVL